MSDPFQRPELPVAISAVQRAMQVCRSVYGSVNADFMQKEDRSPVTVADFASQAVICQSLDHAFPNDPIVGEEDSSELSQPENKPLLERISAELRHVDLMLDNREICRWIDRGNSQDIADRFWTLDPIDGTKGFLRGGQYAISLAFILSGQVEVAVVGCPNFSPFEGASPGALFWAVRGEGSWVMPEQSGDSAVRIHVSQTSDSANARFCESVESGHSRHDLSERIARTLNITKPPLRMDSQAKYATVARGDAEIYLRLPTRADYREKIWDHAGGTLVVEEAGGRVTDLFGNPLDWTQGHELAANRGVVVTNGLLHDAVLAAIAEVNLR
ncbi:MAG: 3'(2'),5'-bisphosphate nucleotidase [Planctomycetaceae bacterium]